MIGESKMFKLFILLSVLNLINGQYKEIPEYPFSNGYSGLNPDLNTVHSVFSDRLNYQSRRESDDQIMILKKFYELDLLRNYQLNFTDWTFIWYNYEEMSVKNQTALIKELRSKQKIIEMVLIQLCEDRCLREFCEMPINQRTVSILPRNDESWGRFAAMKWEDIPLKIKKLIILQLKIDRFRATNSLTMMVNELCPYNKYFDEPTGVNLNRQIEENSGNVPKIQANGNPNNLGGKPIEQN